MAEAIPSPIEGESKDLLETDRLKAVENLSNYQAEMKAWRDKKSQGKDLHRKRPSTPTKPMHWEFKQVRSEMG
jgi:hypothetical protein